jgi:PEP-CTERM motif
MTRKGAYVIAPLCKRLLTLIVLTGLALTSSHANAGILWYNGDYDNRDALANGTAGINFNGPFVQVSKVYENFVVPTGQVWTITSVFSTNEILYQSGAPVTMASWEIRSGLSSGNGGTLVASGDTAATNTPIAENPSNFYNFTPSLVTATVASVKLTAGTYWLSVVADNSDPFFADQSYIETTSGANSVGVPPGNDGNSFISNNLPAGKPGAYNFTATSTIEGAGNWDYSMGVGGTAAPASVPEPSSLSMVAFGVFGTLVCLRRRARTRAR